MSENAPHARIEDLLAHAGWVKDLALRLVRDPGAADDLVQETWLAAMAKPPQGDRPLRGWLAGVVRNLARQRRRGEGRRARREVAVGARREPLPSTDELAGRLETQRDLAEAIMQLAEPGRSTVVLRYLEGLSSAEIARREGVPAATVRGRLKRAIEELRSTLDQRHDGDRHAWLAALVPFLPKPSVPVATGVTSAVVSGVLTMSFTAKLLWSSALLFLVFGALTATDVVPLFGSDDGAAPPLELASEAGAADLGRDGPALTARGTASDAGPTRVAAGPVAEVPAVAGPHARLEARIVDEDGRPLEGAVLYEARRAENRARSSADGTVVLLVSAPPGCGLLDLVAHARGHVIREISAAAHDGETTALGQVALAPGGSVRGRVVDSDGTLLPGARVLATAPDLSPGQAKRARVEGSLKKSLPIPTLAADGTFELVGLPIGFVRVWAGHDGKRFAVSEPIEVVANRPSEVGDLRLDPLADLDAVRGIVRHADGRPGVGTKVSYVLRHDSGGGSASFVVEDDGRFEVRMGTGGELTLRFETDDGYAAPALYKVKPAAKPLQVTLQKSAVLRVRITAEEGTAPPAVGVYVISAASPRIVTSFAGATPKEGIVELAAPPEAYRLDVKAEGYRTVHLGPFGAGQAPEGIEARLERLPTLRGRVLSSTGPVAGAVVSLYRPARKNARVQRNGFDVLVDPNPIARVRSDAEGRYAVGVAEGGRHTLRVDATDYAPSEKRDMVVDGDRGDEGLDFLLSAGGAVQGAVRTATGRASAGLIVGISRGDGHAHTVRTGVAGRFRFAHLMPGAYEVRLVEEEILPGSASTSEVHGVGAKAIPFNCEVREGEVTEHDIDTRVAAAKRASLEGTITVDGAAPRGWTFQLMTEPDGTGLPTTVQRGTIDAEGRFRAEAKIAGLYRVMVTSQGQAQGRRGFFVPVELHAGENRWSVSVKTATIEGTMASGRPSRDVRMLLIWQGQDGAVGMTQIVPNEAGHFRIEGVFAGPSRVVRIDRTAIATMAPQDAMNPANWPTILEVDVKAGRVTTIKIP